MVDRLSHVFTGFEWKDPDDGIRHYSGVAETKQALGRCRSSMAAE
jgi:hypothetical protein